MRASQREAVIIAQGETLGMRFRRMNPPQRGGASLFVISIAVHAIALRRQVGTKSTISQSMRYNSN
jgi:hypothetical protein